MKLQTAVILGSVMAIACTILLYIKVLSKKNDEDLGKFPRFLCEYFTFKKFYLESLLKFVFTLATISCICIGFWMLYAKDYYGWFEQSYTLQGLGLMVGGPIVLRIAYELLMMAIIAVRNITEINDKLSCDSNNAETNNNKSSSKSKGEKIEDLLKSGAITKEEYDLMKEKSKK